MAEKQTLSLVSIILPAYNEERFLDKCIISLKKQSYKYIEIIVIDDGSNDTTSRIALKHNITLIKTRHGGIGRARNIGIKKAKGTIIVFVDADMVLHKDYVNNLIKPILSKQCYGTYTTAEYVANMDKIWAKCWNINVGLKSSDRLKPDVKADKSVFRAILKSKLVPNKRFKVSWGYFDDKSLSFYGFVARPVHNAICYHYNPDTLWDVFLSARWIGRSKTFKSDLKNFIRYSVFNSIMISTKKIFSSKAPISFLFFKIIFDFGIINGLLFKNSYQNYAK